MISEIAERKKQNVQYGSPPLPHKDNKSRGSGVTFFLYKFFHVGLMYKVRHLLEPLLGHSIVIVIGLIGKQRSVTCIKSSVTKGTWFHFNNIAKRKLKLTFTI